MEPAPLEVHLTPPDSDEKTVELARTQLAGHPGPKQALDAAVEIKALAEDAAWVRKTLSGDLARDVEDLLLLCEYMVEP